MIRSLPRRRADAWEGGFVVPSAANPTSISAATGTVLAAGEELMLLRPGATRFGSRPTPAGAGDAVAVAVEPRRPGAESRLAVATVDALHLYVGGRIASVTFPADHGEILQLVWGPDVRRRDRRNVLYVRFPEILLQLAPDGSPLGRLEPLEGELAGAEALAVDGAGGFAFAVHDEEADTIEVWSLADLKADEWHQQSCDAPDFMGMSLAVAGKSVAMSFHQGEVLLTRDVSKDPLAAVESVRSPLEASERFECGPLAFEGAGSDAALFSVVPETTRQHCLVRVDAEGRAQPIAELELEGDPDAFPSVRALAWDATRRTLWGAAGTAGLFLATAPGAPSPFGAAGAS